MNISTPCSRRILVKSSVFGLLAAAVPNIVHARTMAGLEEDRSPALRDERYPAIPLDLAAEVVGVSHFDLAKLKELVDTRQELAKASWDWGFGDWETAIGAASHVGRKDIAAYLISKGASPTIFTCAMFGDVDAVKAMISAFPSIHQTTGPHGISLLQHARLGLENAAMKDKARQLVDYLESLGDADGIKYLPVAEVDRQQYLGDYQFGTAKDEGFTIRLNMKKVLSLGRIGKFGGALLKLDENYFTYNGAPSVRIRFDTNAGKVSGLTITEPGLTLKARKIS